MDLTFSGITTKAINDFKNKNISKEDLCFSMQETLFSMLTEVSERALAHTRKNELLLIGGVAANKRLVEMLSIMCKERDARFFSVPLEYSGDQAVMIAWQGLLEFNKVKKPLDIYPYERIDQIDVEW
jgi:N6-L-threonylcarbamoyladenine synthase/protein kinase Bud32